MHSIILKFWERQIKKESKMQVAVSVSETKHLSGLYVCALDLSDSRNNICIISAFYHEANTASEANKLKF